MFSLENFYYILYTNLFKPARIRVEYFYPFGSTDPKNLYKLVDDQQWPELRHKLYFYDQEPLLENNIKLLEACLIFDKSYKHSQILVTSEISSLKTKLCIKHDFLNLYYFFHGFAALIWYRDYKYFSYDYPFTKHYMSLNHLTTHDRSYRLNLVSHLIDKNLLHKGIVSLHDSTGHQWKDELESLETKLSSSAKEFIKKQLSKISLPLIADTDTPTGCMSAAAGPYEHMFHQKAFLHVVTETVFYYPKLHLTEKIFRPIISKRPFVLVGAPGNLKYLKSYGFKTFDKWIDESYDSEQDHDTRIHMITEQVKKICSLSLDELREMYTEMKDILEYNFYHFYGEFRKIITKELLDNFRLCVVQWNNKQADRFINIDSINFENVEKLLLS